MSRLVPPGWLIAYTTVCYVVFFAFYGSTVFEAAPEADTSGVAAFIETAGDIWTFVTFDALGDALELPLFVSLFLFLTCTVPWFFIIAGAVIEGTKALGSLLPFT